MSKDRTWFLVSKKLAGEANADELNELEALLRSDPDMHYALQNITDLWNLPVPYTQVADEDIFHRHLVRMKDAGINWQHEEQLPSEANGFAPMPRMLRRSRKMIMYGIGVAATLLLMGGIIWYGYYNRSLSKNTSLAAVHAVEKNEISTRNGSKTKITLPDGSKVWLNAGSKLTYNKDFGTDIREVELSGEAFFDVVSRLSAKTGQKIPFIIHTKHIDVHVVGTAFNVKSYPGERQTETSLVRGKVEVLIHNRPDEKIILKPNEKLVVINDEPALREVDKGQNATLHNQPIVSVSTLTYRRTDSLVEETAWVQNKLVFDNESFQDIATRMERWFNVQIEFKDAPKKELRFTGTFENETIQQALDYLTITAPFHYSVQGNRVIIGK